MDENGEAVKVERAARWGSILSEESTEVLSDNEKTGLCRKDSHVCACAACAHLCVRVCASGRGRRDSKNYVLEQSWERCHQDI